MPSRLTERVHFGKIKEVLAPPNLIELQTNYQSERADADSRALTHKFSPDWYQKADAFAMQGDDALTAGRLAEAADAFRKARWHLPGLPANLPDHVARFFGDGDGNLIGPPQT